MQHCRACGQFWFPPSARCQHCLSGDFTWDEVSGDGRVYSFVVYHRLYHPGFERDLPYVVALIDLDVGVRMLSNIVGAQPADLKIGLAVQVAFEDVSSDIALPKFRLAAASP